MKQCTIAAAYLLAVGSAMSVGAGTASAFSDCGPASGWEVGVSDTVSCDFAVNVARMLDPTSRAGGGPFTLTAYSPTTDTNYTVSCDGPAGRSAFECAVWSSIGGSVFLFH